MVRESSIAVVLSRQVLLGLMAERVKALTRCAVLGVPGDVIFPK